MLPLRLVGWPLPKLLLLNLFRHGVTICGDDRRIEKSISFSIGQRSQRAYYRFWPLGWVAVSCNGYFSRVSIPFRSLGCCMHQSRRQWNGHRRPFCDCSIQVGACRCNTEYLVVLPINFSSWCLCSSHDLFLQHYPRLRVVKRNGKNLMVIEAAGEDQWSLSVTCI